MSGPATDATTHPDVSAIVRRVNAALMHGKESSVWARCDTMARRQWCTFSRVREDITLHPWGRLTGSQQQQLVSGLGLTTQFFLNLEELREAARG